MRTNFQFENQNITMVKGDTLAFNVEVFDEAGQPITVDSAFMTCKEVPTREEFVFQKSLSDGITQEDGIMVVRIAPNDTKEAEAGEYFYDFQIGVGQDVFTIMNGTLSLMQNVT